jgi:hypothetical protein
VQAACAVQEAWASRVRQAAWGGMCCTSCWRNSGQVGQNARAERREQLAG